MKYERMGWETPKNDATEWVAGWCQTGSSAKPKTDVKMELAMTNLKKRSGNREQK